MEKQLPNRKSLRLKNYDYSRAGYYFVTICTEDKQNLLCDIVGDAAHSIPQFTPTGHMVQQHLQNINMIYDNAKLDCHIIMPNHIHCIIIIEDLLQQEEGGRLRAATPTSLTKIINSFKTITSKKYGKTLWQRNYYEHVIRSDKELHEISEYIVTNPIKWQLDKYYT
ncbi:MAG: hypothetical protein A2Y23_05215 [Clostridiales bacterium GWB2_37_7]|nr:MAG: hypothetical protein A2Y23_05215 [Clostridiales bacterium GWB2_37_7]